VVNLRMVENMGASGEGTTWVGDWGSVIFVNENKKICQ